MRTNDAMRESMRLQSGSIKCKDLIFQEESTSPIKFSKSSEKNKSSSQRQGQLMCSGTMCLLAGAND